MKILKIILSNIHSLKGKHEIDFDHGILQNVGLYAITGQTGAGKSTILDAVTLALYGQTNRHGDKIFDSEIITRNEKEAFAETTFEVNSNIYMARWEVSVNRNGNLNTSKRYLYLKNGLDLKLLADGKSTCQVEITKIIGLNYEQFSKSILLAQNNFSAFLKAKPTERAEMLSKITGTEIYERISMVVFEKTKDLECAIDAKKAQINVDLFSEQQLEDLRNELILKSTKSTEISTNLNQILAQIKWHEDIVSTNLELQNHNLSLTKLEGQILASSDEYSKLAIYNRAVLIEKELFEFETTKKQVQENEILLHNINKEFENTQKNIDQIAIDTKIKHEETELVKVELAAKLPNIEEAEIQIQKRIAQQNLFNELVKELDEKKLILAKHIRLKTDAIVNKNELLSQINLLEKQESEYKIYSTWNEEKGIVKKNYQLIVALENEISSTKLADVEAKILESKTTYSALTADLELKKTNFATQDSILNSKIEKRKTLKSSEDLFKENDIARIQLILWDDLQTGLIKKTEIEKNFKKYDIQNIALSSSQLVSNQLLINQELKLKILSDNVLLHEKIKSLEAHRADLEEGKDCPLCGAIHHPYKSENTNFTPTETKKEYELAVLFLEKIRKENITLATEKAIVETELKTTSIDLRSFENQINIIISNLSLSHIPTENEMLNNIKNAQLTINQIQKELVLNDALDKEIELSQSQINELNNAIQKITEIITNLNIQIESFKRMQELINKNTLLINNLYIDTQIVFNIFEKKLEDTTKDDIILVGKELTYNYELWHNATQKLQTLKINLNTLEVEIHGFLTIINTIDENMLQLQQKHDTAKISLSKIITSIENLTYHFKIKNPKEEEARIRLLLNQLEKQLNELISKNSGFQSALLETQKNQLIYISNKEKLQFDLQKITVIFDNLLQSNNFETIDVLKNALHLPNHELIAKAKLNHENELLKLKSLIDSCTNKLTELNLLNLTNTSLQSLAIEKENFICENQQLNQDIGGIKEKLDKHNTEFAANQILIKEIEDDQIIFLKWEQLNKLIGSKTGDSFKKFAQDFTLTLLVQFANRHLEVMNKRYELHKAEVSTEMELQIKDKYFFDHVRAVNSLSGGETFLVSLALALGLSDLASKNTKIRSLFIDEGFGSLDPESLNNALDALDLIRQSDDRQIGIISHVEELKKRITTQIKVIKVSSEFSKIEICNN